MKRFLIAAIFSVAALSTAHAGGHKGWSVGAAAIFVDFNDDLDLFDDSVVGFKVSAGYRFNNYFGVEGAYVNTTDFDTQLTLVNDPQLGNYSGSASLSFRGFTGHAVGYIPVAMDDLQPFIRIGYFDFNRDLRTDLGTVGIGHNDGLALGIGTMIKIADDFDIRAEFDWYDAQDADLWSVNLGLQYRFGGSK